MPLTPFTSRPVTASALRASGASDATRTSARSSAPNGPNDAPRRRRLRGSEAGDTLVELMITVAILGVSMVAILGAIWTTIRVADYNSKTSNADAVLRTFAETMKEASGEDTFAYVPCTVAGAQVTYPPYVPGPPYEKYDATVTKIRYLNGYNGSNEPVWAESCPSATDGGLQELTLKVNGPRDDPQVRGTETVTIVKRDATTDVPRTSTDPEDP